MIKKEKDPELIKILTNIIARLDDPTVEIVEVPFVPINDISTILEENLGFDELDLDGEETNGYSVDFWYTYNHKTRGKYSLNGSLWYGNFSMEKISEDDE